MLAKRIIPCLDVNHGRVVKGTNFLDLKDAGDPVEVAARYDQEGADELVYLDITASHEDRLRFRLRLNADLKLVGGWFGGLHDGKIRDGRRGRHLRPVAG